MWDWLADRPHQQRRHTLTVNVYDFSWRSYWSYEPGLNTDFNGLFAYDHVVAELMPVL